MGAMLLTAVGARNAIVPMLFISLRHSYECIAGPALGIAYGQVVKDRSQAAR